MKIDKAKVQLAMLKADIPTLAQLARLAEVTPNTITDILRGSNPRLETLKKLSASLGVDVADIIMEE